MRHNISLIWLKARIYTSHFFYLVLCLFGLKQIIAPYFREYWVNILVEREKYHKELKGSN
jgi:hypothetical protein